MSEPLNVIETSVNVANQSLVFIDNVLDKIDRYKKLQSDKSAYLRLVYLEVINNLEVLQTIDFDNTKGAKPNDPMTKTVLKLLRTDMLESIFYKTDSESANKIYDQLKSRGKINNRSGLIERFTKKKEKEKKDIYENVLEAISFVVTKVHLLKTLETLDESESQLLKHLNIRVRLVNIYERLWMIKNKMGELDEIKQMAR